ncbi:MAG: OmpA family protein [Desulfobacteraceae bacterium]|nr:OmpA family protein [Desulfobacteraceae bacterium]
MMKIFLGFDCVFRGFVCLLLLLCMGLFPGLAWAQHNFRAPRTDLAPSQDIVKKYTNQIAFIQLEIQKIKQDMEWMSLKIKQKEDFGRFVPQKLYDSMEFKQSKINALMKLNNRYENLLKQKKSLVREDNSQSGPNSGFEQRLRKRIVQSDLEGWFEIVPNAPPLRIENRLPILFGSGSAAIPKGYAPFLKKLAALVKGYDVRILVDGFADQDPIHTKQYRSNFELGAARATSVVQALIKYGIKPSVFKISSTGEYRFDSHKAKEWKNLQRHVNIIVVFISTT